MTALPRRFVLLCAASLGPVLAGCERAPDTGTPDTGAATPPDRTTSAPPMERSAAPARGIHLTDVTAESGIAMTMTCGASPSEEILDVNGGGLALFDMDEDGDLDLFVANGATRDAIEAGPGCRLFRNDGDLRFTDVTAASGIDLTRWAMGAAVGDYDGDGRDDLYVACFGPNVLLRNLGEGRFEDVTDAAGVGDPRWGTSAAFGDLDGDGDLDLYVVNYLFFDPADLPPRARHKGQEVMNGPHGLMPQPDALYENLGDGSFRDATATAGCADVRASFGLNVAILDIDGDGRQDVFVGNDSMANFYFRNVGEGDAPLRFEEIGVATGLSSNMDGGNQATMGIAIGDLDANGRPDFYTTNFANDTNTLHLNLDGLFFDDGTNRFGLGLVSRPYLGWGCGLFDLDHDGDEDLLIFNGHVYPEATPETMDSSYEQPPLLFRREGRRFARVESAEVGAWLGELHRDRTAVFGDLDRDGDVDAIVGEVNGPVRVLRNDADGRDDWLVVRLLDERPGTTNHRGVGSMIDVIAGDAHQRRWVVGGGPFQSAAPPEAHFGRGGAPSPVTVVVTWPDGYEQRADGVRWGYTLTVPRD